MASLLQQALRRKPVTELSGETGTDTGGGELAAITPGGRAR